MGKQKSRSLSKTVWPDVTTGPLPRHIAKIGRNEPCPCGSGKKYKDCHQSEGEAYLAKLAREHEKLRLAEVREHLRQQGVPWYKRLFVRQ